MLKLYFEHRQKRLALVFLTGGTKSFIFFPDGLNKIKKAEKNSTDDGMIKLLELLKNKKQAGWFQAFIEALRKNGWLNRIDYLLTI